MSVPSDQAATGRVQCRAGCAGYMRLPQRANNYEQAAETKEGLREEEQEVAGQLCVRCS